MGGENPIRIQSMLTSATQEVSSCLSEIRSLEAVDCELIRLAIPSRKDLDSVPQIRRLMREEGIRIPLVADIHFSPRLAVEACELFEKIRINPGNYTDSPKTKSSRETESQNRFAEGREKLKGAILPLARQLKKHKRALRIGVNQGSLSTRMMERFGDSPVGMVQSALEMIELFEEQGINQLVVSLKSSNPVVVQKAYRLLVEKQAKNNAVALHLGVTEAGNGAMARIKSLVGIGALLIDGIGDTIRISLTEPCANEVAFAEKLLSSIFPREEVEESVGSAWLRPINHQRVDNRPLDLGHVKIGGATGLKIGRLEDTPLPEIDIPFETDFTFREDGNGLFLGNQTQPVYRLVYDDPKAYGTGLRGFSALMVETPDPLVTLRGYYKRTDAERRSVPVGMVYPKEDLLYEEIQMAAILSEGLLDFLSIPGTINSERLTRLLYLLQATRAKIVATDYIACPSCGRTLFDLESTTERIKKHTRHLKGLKIGIMGCIVNGPGEMADADFGYVGSGTGKIDLYFGQSKVCRGIDEKDAVERLVELIKEKGMWKEVPLG
ncbi:MAG: (E)-4-hydroxy-3-methylbut-2-enyl-diphosphate synthase [Proteobacteria bacterium]|nr:(E)-4-hydroxy-3-methylbut-2-enyl-diphosphate synthase [Pseudomonadota bacterium]